ncbi:Oidioi.mRNA.OKI2018_I69.chr1.g3045.t1.cds [Oikopleura dioica]|uniref:Acyl-CoA-binding domain-containing protein 6 n=1 Tax=Oikopleura dioica TaxID=34765 RepID=A0ABN7SXA4_OIKDI|nr:Oidioi.mRNA.OKI2018_I69.chr1.g3045.t1.cds [Oikopleura dioica]
MVITSRRHVLDAPKPGFLDFKGKKKYASWEKASVCSKEDAMERYVGLVKENFADFKPESVPADYTKKPSNIMAKRVSRMAPVEQPSSDKEDLSEILVAARDGEVSRIEELLLKEPLSIESVDDAKRTALHWAVDRENTDVVEYLLGKAEYNETLVNATDEDGCTALHYAATSESEQILRILVKYGADPTIEDNFGETPKTIAPGLF